MHHEPHGVFGAHAAMADDLAERVDTIEDDRMRGRPTAPALHELEHFLLSGLLPTLSREEDVLYHPGEWEGDSPSFTAREIRRALREHVELSDTVRRFRASVDTPLVALWHAERLRQQAEGHLAHEDRLLLATGLMSDLDEEDGTRATGPVQAEVARAHRRIARGLDLVRSTLRSPYQTVDHCKHVFTDLSRHDWAMTLRIYPRLHDILGTQAKEPIADLVSIRRAAHTRMLQVEQELMGAPGSRRSLADLMRELDEMYHRHIDIEESLTRKLGVSLPYGQAQLLADELRMTTRTLPSRPHPGLVFDGRWGQAISPVVALADRFRTATDSR